jgi:hypothetical protein
MYYVLLIYDSSIFATIYEHGPKFFKSSIDKILFSGDQEFAKQYFAFFGE